MAECARPSRRTWVVLAAATSALLAAPVPAQVLPWEVAVAEIEVGRIRNLAERISKQNLLYLMRLGDVNKEDLVVTSEKMDRVIQTLQQGSPSYSIPAPWTPALQKQTLVVAQAWDRLRPIALASPYQSIAPDFAPSVNRSADPLLIRHFDDLSGDLIAESEILLELYHDQCVQSGLGACPTARTSGYAAMIIERATKQAVYIVAGIESAENRKGLGGTMEAYRGIRKSNDENPFFAAALDPARGVSAEAAGELLVNLRLDWDALAVEFKILEAGDETNFDLRRMLEIQARLVAKVERLTGALVRYASSTYGS